MTTVPYVRALEGVDPTWNDALRAALAEVNATPSSRAAMTFPAGWVNYGGWAECQVIRWGNLVVSAGLIKNNTGAAVTPVANYLIATIPVGYRPRDVGSVAPLGGRIITTQFSQTAALYRIDFLPTGAVYLDPTTPTPIPNGGYMSLNAMWAVE